MAFLDDELYQIGKSADTTTKEGLFNAINSMIKASMNNLSERIAGNENYYVIEGNFKRVAKTWEMVCDKLEKEGVYVADRNGFEKYIKING